MSHCYWSALKEIEELKHQILLMRNCENCIFSIHDYYDGTQCSELYDNKVCCYWTVKTNES